MKNLIFKLLILGFAVTLLPAAGKKRSKKSKNNVEKILEKAEFIRNPSEDYSSKVYLLDDKNGKKEEKTFESVSKGRDKALVKYLTPAVEKGTKVLLVGQDMWVQVPSSAKPVRISASQKLSGNAAYGDVARLSFIGNYTAKLVRTDKLDGQEAYVLDLTSIEGRPVTYDRIEYWVAKKNYHPLKAIYKTSSGKVIREGSFTDFAKVLGVVRPQTMILVNSLNKNHKTTLKFSDVQKKEMPDLLFEKQNLGRN